MSNNTPPTIDYAVTSPNTYAPAILFLLSATVFILLSFTQKRTKKAQNCCWGRPGIVYPINLLNPRHRFVYVLACGALSSQWFGLIVRSEGFTNVNQWASNIVQICYIILLITLVVIITYPILACVEAPIPIVGYAVGAIYTAIFFGLMTDLIVEEGKVLNKNSIFFTSQYKAILFSRLVITYLPQQLCLLGVFIWYVYEFIKEIVRLCKAGEEWKTAFFNHPETQINNDYVRRLFNERNPSFFRKHIYTRIKLPLHVLIVFVVSTIVIFQLIVLVVFQFPYWFNLAATAAHSLVNGAPDLQDYELFNHLPKFLDSLTAITVISPLLAAVILFGHFCHFTYTVKALTKEFRNGKVRQDNPDKFQLSWPALVLASSLRYAGFQVAAIITGWIVYTVLVFVLLLLLMAVIFFPSFLGYYVYQLAVIGAWTVFLTVSQMAICKLLFVDKESNSAKTLIITNRRVYNFFSYAMLLYNIATGLMTAIIRVALSFISMVLLLPRMDRIIFLKGFERLDSGFGMFNGFMAVENSLQNPIVRVFVTCVQASLKDREGTHLRYEGSLKYFAEASNPLPAVRSVKARNRWFVAFTLIHNPRLRKTAEAAATPYKDTPPLNYEEIPAEVGTGLNTPYVIQA